MSKKFTSTIAGASLLITSVGLISRGFGFIREATYAGKFGLQNQFDIYLIGAVVPIIINTAILYLSQNYFIPAYHKKQQLGKAEAGIFFKNTFWQFVSVSILLSTVLYALSSTIISLYLGNSSSADTNLALSVFQIFLFTIPFNAGTSIFASYMQAEFNFKAPAISNLFLNISIITLVILFSADWGIFTIPIGYLTGSLLQFTYLFFNVKKQNEFSLLSFNFRIFRFENTNRMIFLIVLIEVFNQLYILIDRYFYSDVNHGGIASLNYATVLFTLPISIFSLALSTAIFPQLSQSFNANNHELLQHHFNRGLRINIFIFMPITFIFIFFGDGIIKLLYERGQFTTSDTLMTYGILKIYALGFLFYAPYAVVNKMIYGAGLIKQLLIISIFIFLLKIILNFGLVNSLNTEGLALATTICYISISLIGYLIIQYKLKIKGTKEIVLSGLLLIFSAFIAFFISQQVTSLVKVSAVITFILNFIVFISVYWLNVHFVNHEEYLWVKNLYYQMLGESRSGYKNEE